MENILQNWYSGASVSRLGGARGTGPTLDQHQKSVVAHMKTHHRLLVIHGTGSGKTLTAVHVANDYLNSPKRIVIFITPSAVQDQFKRTASLLLSGKPGVYFTTYDGLTRFFNKLLVSRHETMRQVVKHAMIIADEAHYITEKTEKARVFYEVFRKADKVLLLTGTPIQNGKIKDLVPYAKILNPTQTDFPRNLPIEKLFRCKVSVYFVPSTSTKFPKLLPTSRVSIPLSKKQATNVATTRAGQYNWTTVMTRLSSATFGHQSSIKRGGWAFNRQIYANKIFKNIDSEPKFLHFLKVYKQRPYKTVVYFQQYVSLDRFREFLTRHGIPFQEISGRPNKTNKSGINSLSGNTVYLLTKAAKEGLDFKGVRTVVFMDFPWTPSNYNQVVGRARRYQSHIHLPVTERNVKVYEFSYNYKKPKTLNVRSLNILNTKRTSIKKLMDRLISVSIEKLKCASSPANTKSASPPNRLQPRPNRRIVKNALGTYVAVSPGGRVYHASNLDKFLANKLVVPSANNRQGFAALGKRKRV